MSSPAERFAAARRRGAAQGRYPRCSTFAATYDFGLDEFQLAACRALEDGEGVLVAAPTGAGKTVVGEFAVHLALAEGAKCFYTTPIKALSNQKFADLVARHGAANVGLLTGDNAVHGNAPIVVMTTEVLRNMLYARSPALAGLGYVVMDEVHYLADRFRGAVWEEVIIHLPAAVRLVSLSATVSNAEEFAEWLVTVRGHTRVVVEERRPVPLWQHVLAGSRLYDLFLEHETGLESPAVQPALLRLAQDDARLARSGLGRGARSTPRRGASSGGDRRAPSRVRVPSRAEVIGRLDGAGLLPAITFIFSRAGCDATVLQCLRGGLRLTTTDERARIRAHVRHRMADLPAADRDILGYPAWLDGLERGLAAHHAGMLPSFKEVVEELFVLGLVKAVFATETLALGINMPARSVVLERLVKWNGEAHVDVTPGEYTQLTGRAGRRGIDVEGHAAVRRALADREAQLARDGATERRADAAASLERLRRGDVIRVPAGRRSGLAVVLDAGLGDSGGGPRPTVPTVDRQVKRLSTTDFPTPVAALSAVKVPKGFNPRSPQSRRDLASSLRNLDLPEIGGRPHRRGAAPNDLDLARLRAAQRQPPRHGCTEREDHVRWAERHARLTRDTEALRRRVESRRNTIARTFDRVCALLSDLGYLAGEEVPPAGLLLAGIYAESDLLVAECLRGGVFEGLSPAELAGCVSALVYEARQPEDAPPRLPGGRSREALGAMVRIWGRLSEAESEHRLDFLREPDLGFAWPAYRWASGQPLDVVLTEADLAAGDFVRWVRQLLDLLDQVAAVGDPPVRRAATAAVSALRRGVVAYSSVG